jgi:hypothetical protein
LHHSLTPSLDATVRLPRIHGPVPGVYWVRIVAPLGGEIHAFCAPEEDSPGHMKSFSPFMSL